MNDRATLISSGEHIFAVAKLKELGVGDTYTPEAYLKAIELAREVRAGERYAARVLGTEASDDVVSGLDESEVGAEAMVRAAADLRGRGINPAAASCAQLRDALVRVKS
jgi:hypothetical protein